ncbi:MAG: inositol-3-phosphate synthase [Candidatus Heimdallarchaeota archaeon]|nr:inositol-3-phosphate synthase [Candidatus Heimdallarchaeota archaeon]MCK5143721.1 inositol-3-phosphate synthase [Candidatus Heimdallarchaeota archaeon]
MESDEIRIAIAGIGNIASGLLQGITYLNQFKEEKNKLLHPKIGSYEAHKIRIVAAFDIDSTKVQTDISDAIFAPINSTPKLFNVEKIGVQVEKGPVKDGLSEILQKVITIADVEEVDVVSVLKETDAEMLICAIPSGAEKAVEAYAQAALDAEIAFINCTPTRIASDHTWSKRYKQANICLIGDDLQSLAGGTVLHKGFLDVLKEQGVIIKDTYQLDVAGGLDTLNTLDDDRKEYKRKVKERSIQQSVDNHINIASGTSDYLEFLGNRRIGHFWIYGEGFMNMPVKIDIRLETLDGPNGAATLIDVIRATKLAQRRAGSGPISSICAFGFKAPPVTTNRHTADKWFDEYIEGKRID